MTSDPSFSVIEKPEHGRFELLRDDNLVGFASYQLQGDSVVVPHVETLPEYRGQGYAARLMEGLLDIIEADGRGIVPHCSFAAGHVRDNPRPTVAGAA